MLILQITDTHIKHPGKLAYSYVDTEAMLRRCVDQVMRLDPLPDVVVLTGDLVDLGLPEEYAHLRRILAPLRMPVYAIPGNHDDRDAMRHAFRDGGYLPATGFLHYAVDDWPVRLIGLDTLIPMQGGGELCSDRLGWLEDTLARRPSVPTLIMMHHPPFATGIAHMDRIGLDNRDAFTAIMARHPQVQTILCGHLHRSIQAVVGGRRTTTCPSPAHQVALDLTPDGPSAFRMEPPGYMLHLWRDGALISHTEAIGDYAGPYPFFGPDGKLIG
jgi:3',5'-cyclic AMP phosphodiesterase CpdA